jgi:small-conductance mechanosensitive channel
MNLNARSIIAVRALLLVGGALLAPTGTTAQVAQNPPEILDPQAAVWSERVAQWAQRLEPVFGPWLLREVFLGITWLGVILSVLILCGAALAWLVLHGLMRRWIRKKGEAAEKERLEGGKPEHLEWFRQILRAALPPLSFLVWVWGIYAAGFVLFAQLSREAERTVLLRLLNWLLDVGGLVGLFWFLFRLIAVVGVRLKSWASVTDRKWDDILATIVVRALRLVVPLVGLILILPTLSIPAGAEQFFRQGSSLLLIAAIGFIAYQVALAAEEAVLEQYRMTTGDNLTARKIATQVQVLRKLAVVVIVVFTIGSMLMVFESVRQLGASILASAGVVGIIVGFAAQRSIATILAGFQIAMTQPIRLDDVVIVENEWGRIEEITLTYVVVKIWDLRRMVVPINYFIEKPFQNWTRVSSDILGAVIFYLDYSVPLAELRNEAERIIKSSKHWDGKFWNLQVTDATERTMQLRVLVTARDSGKAFDLRCEVREQLLRFLQERHPESLPRVRAHLDSASEVGLAIPRVESAS